MPTIFAEIRVAICTSLFRACASFFLSVSCFFLRSASAFSRSASSFFSRAFRSSGMRGHVDIPGVEGGHRLPPQCVPLFFCPDPPSQRQIAPRGCERGRSKNKGRIAVASHVVPPTHPKNNYLC